MFTETPRKPANLSLSNLSDSSQVLLIKWSAPENIARFDLEHYSIQVLIISGSDNLFNHEQHFIITGTTTEPNYLLDIGLIASSGTIHSANITVTVTAVSKCKEESHVATMQEPLLLKTNPALVHTNSAQSANRSCE